MIGLFASPEIDAQTLSRVLKERGLTVTSNVSSPPLETVSSLLLVSRTPDQVADLLTQAGDRNSGAR